MDASADNSEGETSRGEHDGIATRAALLRIGVMAVSLFVLWGVAFRYFSSEQPDDTHITYWEAFALAKFGSILNYNGAPLETSSSLAHAALTALAHRLTGVAIPTLGLIVPALFGGLTVYYGAAITARIAPRFATVGALLVATTPWLLFWVCGGLDAPIAAAALAALAWTAGRCVERPSKAAWVGAGFAIALAVTARPEGPMIVLATLTGATAFALLRALRRGQRLASALAPYAMLAALACGEAGALSLYRKLVFHVWMPNAVYAKAEILRPTEGAAYIARHTGYCAAWILVGLAVALGTQLSRALRAVPAAPDAESAAADVFLDFAICGCIATLGFVVAAGGDWMFRGRFLAPMAGLAVPAALASIDRLVPKWPPAARRAGVSAARTLGRDKALVAVVSVLALWLAYGSTQELEGGFYTVNLDALARTSRSLRREFPRHEYSFFEISNYKHLRDIYGAEALDQVIEALAPLGRPIVVATRQAGFVPYHIAKNHYGAVHIVDALNLATDDVRRCAPKMLHRLVDTADNPMNGFGYAVGVSYNELLGQKDVFGPCGLTPDVIYDIGAPRKRLFAATGYVVVYEQYNVKKGRDQSFIAMREDLASDYQIEARTLER